MKYKKYISIMIVSILILTSITLVAPARMLPLENNKIEDTGTIVKKSTNDQDIWFILGDDNESNSITKKTYYPTNWEEFESFKIDGLKVDFTAERVPFIFILSSLKPREIVSLIICILRNNYFPIIPVKILTLEEVQDENNEPPIADFSYTPEKPKVDEAVNFVDESTDDHGIIAWSWNFGDGIVSNKQNPVHHYTKSGEYNVSLSVKDEHGLTNKISKTITIVLDDDSDPDGNEPPIAGFSYTPEKPTVNDLICFLDESTDDNEVVTWNWDFGDETESDEQNPTHKYTEPGEYSVTLIVMDKQGEKSTITKIVPVLEEDDGSDPGTAVLFGKVVEIIQPAPAIKEPIPDVNIVAILRTNDNLPVKIYSTKTNEDGYYELEVTPGSYIVIASKDEYKNEYQTVEFIADKEKKQINFQLELVKLDFNISMKSEYTIGEPIEVSAVLENKAFNEIKVSEISLELKTLDFFIINPDNNIIHYIGPYSKVLIPNSKIIKPGDYIEYRIDLLQKRFGILLPPLTDPSAQQEPEVYTFSKPGTYQILGVYQSYGPDDGRFHGTLSSFPIQSFELIEKE